jgi:peptidoglycan/LPS O-acetylase OafA/YrhL
MDFVVSALNYLLGIPIFGWGDRVGYVWLALILLVALLFAHDADHLVNEDRLYELTTPFWVFLPFQYGAFALVIALVWRRDPRGPRLAVLLGALTVVGFIVSHVLPFGLAPYPDYDAPAISWILVFVPMAAALLVLYEGRRLARARHEGALA